jgi:UrcA family protein
MINLRLRTAVFSAALLLPLAANAGTVTVQSRDLNLTTDAGRAQLRHRIAHAVDAVCGPAHARTAEDAQAYASCSKSARAGAALQFDTVVAAAQNSQKVASDRGDAAALR